MKDSWRIFKKFLLVFTNFIPCNTPLKRSPKEYNNNKIFPAPRDEENWTNVRKKSAKMLSFCYSTPNSQFADFCCFSFIILFLWAWLFLEFSFSTLFPSFFYSAPYVLMIKFTPRTSPPSRFAADVIFSPSFIGKWWKQMKMFAFHQWRRRQKWFFFPFISPREWNCAIFPLIKNSRLKLTVHICDSHRDCCLVLMTTRVPDAN